MLRRRKTEEDLWGMKKYFFADNKNGEGKEGKYHGEGKIVAGRDGWTGRRLTRRQGPARVGF